MTMFDAPHAAQNADLSGATAPLVVLFERDDAVAVPLLSQVRLAGYDVRAARTPVELFGLLGKELVSLVLVDLGNATAGRREFWVALDAQRRGRALQVMTFRLLAQDSLFDMEEPSARALADVEVHGAHEFQKIVEGVRQRVALHGNGHISSPSAASAPSFGMPGTYGLHGTGAPAAQPGAFGASPLPEGIQPIGALLGVPSPYMNAAPFSQPAPQFSATPPPADASLFAPASPTAGPSPFGQPPSAGWAPIGQPAGDPFGGAAPIASFGQSATEASPFAQPAMGNPFAAEVAESQFSQPYSANPFAADAAPAPSPFAAGGFGGQPSSDPAPWGASAPFGQGMFGPASAPQGQPAFAAGYGLPEQSVSQPSIYGAFSKEPASFVQSEPSIADAWSPPTDDLEGATGVVPELAFKTPARDASTEKPGRMSTPSYPGRQDPWDRDARSEDFDDGFIGYNGFTEYRYEDVDDGGLPASGRPPQAEQPTQRVPTPATGHVPQSRTETALGNVLVEGALLSEDRLETLRGIQQMLSGVEMNFKLGELAMLFKFLSPDQLLAAVLVSRGLVSPQQIASLGRVKQELGTSGMDNDLETLLVRFNILPAEELRKIRAELRG